jgi:hypothetical protein
MRRAIPILAAALLASGAGCVTRHCDSGSLTIDWSFPDATGNDLGCDAAGVSYITITIDGVPQTDENGNELIGCYSQYIQYAPFTSATRSVLIEGLDANQRQLYVFQDDGVATNGCGDVALSASLTLVTADLDVTYSIASGGSEVGCATPTAASPYATTFIWYRIRDLDGNVVSAADDTVNSSAIPCSDTNSAFTVPDLALGTYTIDGVEEVQLNADRTFDVVSYNCNPTAPFQHDAPGDTVAAPQMVVGSFQCF